MAYDPERFKFRSRRAGAFSLACLLSCYSAKAQLFISREFNPNAAVPDFGEVLDSRAWNFGNAPIDEVRVRLDISGLDSSSGFNGDLYVALSYNEELSILLNRAGKSAGSELGYSDNGFSIWFSDSSAQGDVHVYRETLFGDSLTPLTGPLTGTWSPDARLVDPDVVTTADARTAFLNVFSGSQSGNPWHLFVADLSPGASHVLNSWALELAITGPFTGGITLNSETLRAGLNLPVIPNSVSIAGPVHFSAGNPISFTGDVTLNGSQTLDVNNVTSFVGAIGESTGASQLIKEGSGTLQLSGPNEFTGGVLVMAGLLSVQNTAGSATGSGQVTISDGASLGGSGSISGPVFFESGSRLAPGDSPGVISLGSTTFEAGFAYDVQFNQVTGGQGSDPGWDLVLINGQANFLGTPDNPVQIHLFSLTLDNNPGPVADFDPALNYAWTILIATDGINGFDPNSLEIIPVFFMNADPNFFEIINQGNSLQLLYTVPEPSTLLLGLGALAFLARRRSATIQKRV